MLFSFQCLCEICGCLIFTLFTQNDNVRSSVNCCAVCIEKHALCSTAGAAQCFSPLTLTHSCADLPGSRQHLVYLPEKSPGSGLWQLTFFLCNLDLSIYTSAAVLFIDMTPLYLLSAENRCSPIRKVNLDITVELRKSEIFLIIHFGMACFYWWCGDRGPLSKWGEWGR